MKKNYLPPTLPLEKHVSKVKNHVVKYLDKSKLNNIIIAVSGGIDSATSLYLLKKSLDISSIFVVHMYYFENSKEEFYKTIDGLNINSKNILLYSIKKSVDKIAQELGINKKSSKSSPQENLRRGNIMARTRMIYLYDLAKKHKALVCGTENKSEYYLGYFTRYGDQASDIEIINYLYKTQVFELAKALKVPKSIINKKPSADLWSGQSDEAELGFSYEKADQIIYLHFEKGLSAKEIEKMGFSSSDIKKILDRVYSNNFKHKVPYFISNE